MRLEARFFREAFLHRMLLIKLVERDISGSYSGSVLGNLWAFIDPLIYVALTMFFFQFAIRGVDTGGVPYVAWVLPQIMFWTFISSVVNGSVASVKEYSFLMRHRNFDLRLISLIKLFSSLVIHLFLITIVLVILYAALGVPVGWRVLMAVYYLFCMCVLLVSISWIVSSLGVFWKDIRNIVSLIMQVEFWISPIFWTAERFPKPIAILMYINPFYYPMQGYRQSLLNAELGQYSLILGVYFWIACCVSIYIGSKLFTKLSSRFGDVI